MRMLFLTLALFNLAFFAWLEYQKSLPNPDAIAHAPLQADRIAILPAEFQRTAIATASTLSDALDTAALSAASTLAGAAKAAAPTASMLSSTKPSAQSFADKANALSDNKSTKTCMNWAGLGPSDAEKAIKDLEKIGLGEKIKQFRTEEPTSYWVYVPPRSNAKEAERKVAELKELGVKDLIIISESGSKWLHAISLGVFKTEEGAKKRFAELQERGVKTAQVGERTTQIKEVRLFITDPGDRADKVRGLFKALNQGALREGC